MNTRRAKFEAALTKLHEGLSKPNCVKEYDKVLRRLGREIERHKRVSFQYKVNVRRKTELYSTFVISQVVCDDVVPAELAHLHSEVVRYLGTSRNNRLSG